MIQLISFPLSCAGLFALWLLFNETLSLGHILLGLAVAFMGSWSLTALELPKARPRRYTSIIWLVISVFADIVRSNAEVAFIILGLKRRRAVPGFVAIPLELRDRYGLAALACIITSTPGTVWVDFNEADGTLTIHVLDLVDRSDWVRTIKGRYERLLLEIFV